MLDKDNIIKAQVFQRQLRRSLQMRKIIANAPLGRNELIVRFTSAAHPNLQFKNPTFLGRKNEVSKTADMWL